MRQSGPAVFLVVCALSASVFPAEVSDTGGLFFDDFSTDPALRWIPFDLSEPRITPARGNPAPALDLQGGGRRRNGVISKRLFHLAPGMTVRADIFVSASSGASSFGGSIGFPRDREVFLRGRWPEWLVGMSYDYIGEYDPAYAAIPEGGTLTCILIDEDGRLELHRRPYLNRWLGGWHTFEILIRRDSFVEFRLDGELVYYSRKRLAYGYSHLPLLLGQHSVRRGRVYHDNVAVLSLSP